MKTKIIILWILLLIPMYTFAQKEYVSKMNQFNARGEKNGYWIAYFGDTHPSISVISTQFVFL